MKRILDPYDHYTPNDTQVSKINQLRPKYKEIRDIIEKMYPDCEPKRIALEHLLISFRIALLGIFTENNDFEVTDYSSMTLAEGYEIK